MMACWKDAHGRLVGLGRVSLSLHDDPALARDIGATLTA